MRSRILFCCLSNILKSPGLEPGGAAVSKYLIFSITSSLLSQRQQPGFFSGLSVMVLVIDAVH